MKKQLIATLVAGILLFLWQFLSWAQLNVHGNEMQYTGQQDTILQMLGQQNLKGGTYMLPMPAPNSTPEQQQAFMDSSAGKPWATVSYHASMNASMGMGMFRGFIVDLLAAFLLIWMLLKMTNLDFKTALLSSWAVGAIGYLTIPYLNSIWYETNSMGYLIDVVVGWGLVGAWLGWFLTRK
ncbi:MAG: hypothetical protein HY842_19375 [Bacteroidetes bacterium]|nr:hypothetical protein [Bacteroidota bacterium]